MTSSRMNGPPLVALAAVCDGGLWDLHERAFFASRFAMSDVSIVPVPHSPLMASSVDFPVLITLGALVREFSTATPRPLVTLIGTPLTFTAMLFVGPT